MLFLYKEVIVNILIQLQNERREKLKERLKDILIYVGLTVTFLGIVMLLFFRGMDTVEVEEEPEPVAVDFSVAHSDVLEELSQPQIAVVDTRNSKDVYIHPKSDTTSREEFIKQVAEIEKQIEELKPLTVENPFKDVAYQQAPPGVVSVNASTKPPSSITMSDEDYQCLLRITEAEAGGEDAKGKRMVTFTILNRVSSSRFPNSVKEVVYSKNSKGGYQYTPLTNGRYFSCTPSSSTKEAVDEAIRMYERGEDETFGAEFFMAPTLIGVDPASSERGANWQRDNLSHTVTHGVHEFRKYP